jgi:molecular chaperone GrpE
MSDPTTEAEGTQPVEGGGDNGVATTEPDAAAAIEHDLDRLLDERDQMRSLAQQIQADFENYRKQAMKRETAIVERASETVLEQLLPVLDSFDAALMQLSADTDPALRKGVELVFAQLVGVLEHAGLERIDADGQPFDPNEHEAVLQDDGEGEPVVAETMRTGYRLKGRVLRPAMVKVSR